MTKKNKTRVRRFNFSVINMARFINIDPEEALESYKYQVHK